MIASVVLGCVIGAVGAAFTLAAVSILGHVRPVGLEFDSAFPAAGIGFVFGLMVGLILFRRDSDPEHLSISSRS
ncbi:MAG: hypothetical protein L0Z53_12150, partial [Acidobacteriales bacterium]|nr:hypothetical protein [Terriglobales bacterium]